MPDLFQQYILSIFYLDLDISHSNNTAKMIIPQMHSTIITGIIWNKTIFAWGYMARFPRVKDPIKVTARCIYTCILYWKSKQHITICGYSSSLTSICAGWVVICIGWSLILLSFLLESTLFLHVLEFATMKVDDSASPWLWSASRYWSPSSASIRSPTTLSYSYSLSSLVFRNWLLS